MPVRELALPRDADAVSHVVRALAASVNVAILAVLIEARSREDAGDGWVYLSEIAERLDEAAGTVSLGVQKLVPDLVEEKREKGKRYFRARVNGLSLVLTTPAERGPKPVRIL